VQGWDEQPSKDVKIYLSEKYKSIPSDFWEEQQHCDQGIRKDENGFYILERDYKIKFPELEFTQGSWLVFSNALNLNSETCYTYGEIKFNEIQSIIKKCLVLLNTKHKNDLIFDSIQLDGVSHLGVSKNYVEEKLSNLLNLLKFAFERKTDIYYG
jgi:hypothetical protein